MDSLNGKGDFGKSPHKPTRYELIDKDGKVVVQDTDVKQLVFLAEGMWPDQEQDEERSGRGWDIQVMGADR